jgi:hypothetical protein
MNEAQLIKAIKAHIAKGDHAKDKAEQHYISAGQHLKTLKAQHETDGGNWAEWAELLRSRCDLITGRASELMQIADGRTSQEKIREKDAERKRLARDKERSSGHPEENPPPDKPENPLITAWVNANRKARHGFVRACWAEIMRARDQDLAALAREHEAARSNNLNGNGGADHWAFDRWGAH